MKLSDYVNLIDKDLLYDSDWIAQRNERILMLYDYGVPMNEIQREFKIKKNYLHKIIKKTKEKSMG